MQNSTGFRTTWQSLLCMANLAPRLCDMACLVWFLMVITNPALTTSPHVASNQQTVYTHDVSPVDKVWELFHILRRTFLGPAAIPAFLGPREDRIKANIWKRVRRGGGYEGTRSG